MSDKEQVSNKPWDLVELRQANYDFYDLAKKKWPHLYPEDEYENGVSEVMDAERINLWKGFALARIAQPAYIWRPIETAPQDGTEFLCYREQDIQSARWHQKNGELVLGGRGWSYCTRIGFPTHWMPLPKAPE